MSSLARIALAAALIGIVLAVAFSFAYPHVEITTGLIALFALVGVVVAAGIAALLRRRDGKP